MIVSICIPSYNRPSELRRCLESIPYLDDEIEVLVHDDCSPKIDEIRNLDVFSNNRNIKLIEGTKNVGFDENFYSLINAASGKYLLFCTDDDYFIAEGLVQCIKILRNEDASVIVTPYVDAGTGLIRRQKDMNKNLYTSKIHGSTIFDFILLSGLIIRRECLPRYDVSILSKSIYSQVFVCICSAIQRNILYLNTPLVYCAADGENGFVNTNDPLKADRNHYLSNLQFHKGLIVAIHYADDFCNAEKVIIRKFEREYALRSSTGMLVASKSGRLATIEYLMKMKKLPIKTGILPLCFACFIFIFGHKTTIFAHSIAKSVVEKVRKWIL